MKTKKQQALDLMAKAMELMKEEEVEKSEEWPKVGDEVWVLFCDAADSREFTGNEFDKNCLDRGLVLRTLEEAELADQARIAVTKIKNYAREQWGEFKPDWEKQKQGKWTIGFSGDSQRFETLDYAFLDTLSPIGHFREEEHVEEIIKKFPEELEVIRRFYT